MPSPESPHAPEYKTMELPVQTRAAALGGVNMEKREVTFSFSSTKPAQKMFGLETLSHEKGAMVTERLDSNSVPFLFQHDWDRAIGQVTSYSMEDGRAYATAKMSRSPLASEVLQDIGDNVRPSISVGYVVEEMKLLKSDDKGNDEYLITKWCPIEVSSVSIPADTSCRIVGGPSQKTYSARVLGGGWERHPFVKENEDVAPTPTNPEPDPVSEPQPAEVQKREVVKETVVTTEEIIAEPVVVEGNPPVIKKVQDTKPMLSTEPGGEAYTIAYKETLVEPTGSTGTSVKHGNPQPPTTVPSETTVTGANTLPVSQTVEGKIQNQDPPRAEVKNVTSSTATTVPAIPLKKDDRVISQNIAIKAQKIVMPEEIAENQKLEVIKENEDSLNKIRDTEHSRIREITALGVKFDCQGDANEWIRRGKTIQEFHSHILNNKVFSQAPIRSMDPSLGMRPQEQKRYCLTRAILAASEGKLGGFELECSKELEAQVGRKAAGFFVPEFAFSNMGRRSSPPDLTAVTSHEGAELIQTTVEPSLIPFLRNKMVLGRAGCTMMGGLVGNMALPRQISAATATWNTENFDPTRTGQTFDQVPLNPQRLSAVTAFSKQLLAQSQLDVQTVVRDDLLKIIAIAQDLAGLSGSGSANQPLGILNTVADTVFPSSYSKTSPSITFASGFPTWTNVVAFEGNVESNNIDLDDPSCCYIMSPAVKALWKTLSKTDPRALATGGSFYPSFIWEEGADLVGRINGYKSFATNQVSATNQVIFGKFSDLVLGTWGGIDLIADPYTLASSFQIRVIINLLTTIALRYGPAFCYSTNSGLV